jgi:hypothetical protein
VPAGRDLNWELPYRKPDGYGSAAAQPFEGGTIWASLRIKSPAPTVSSVCLRVARVTTLPAVSLDLPVQASAFGAHALLPAGQEALLAATREALREKRTATAAQLAAAILDAGSNLEQLARIFAKAQEIERLVQLIWDRRETSLRSCAPIATFMRLCYAAEGANTRVRALRSWLFDDSTPPPSFTFRDTVRRLKRIGILQSLSRGVAHRLFLDLFLVKYRGWNDQSFSENIATLARRCEVPQKLAELLYSHSSHRGLDFLKWLHEFKAAQAKYHVLKEARTAKSLLHRANGSEQAFLERFSTSADILSHVGMIRAKRVFDGLDTSRGLVLCTFHGAHLFVLYDLCKKFMSGHYALTQAQIRRSGAEESDGRRNVGFRAVKALMDKKAVLIAPDGPYSGESTCEEITVFGIPGQVSFGAAVLAYEARSKTGWISMAYEDERLVPVYVPGPAPQTGETLAQFKVRWLSFYSAQLEAFLSSNPKNLAVDSSRWFDFGSKGTW